MGFRVRAENGRTTIYLYDAINEDIGVSAAEFVDAIDSAKTPIDLRINSPGGDAWAGKAMAEAVKAARVPVVAYGDGLVASAATLPAIAADAFHMKASTNFVIHQAWTVTIGNAPNHESSLKHLYAGDEFLLTAYEERTGQSREQLLAWMAGETWFSPSEAIAAGFANEEIKEVGIAALIPRGFNFANIPDGVTVAASCDDSWYSVCPASKSVTQDYRDDVSDLRDRIRMKLSGA